MRSRAAFVSAAVTAAAISLAAQSAAPARNPDPQRPVFRTEANFVRVDVFPTRDGSPVRDLQAADFEVIEDGVSQKVETFEFVQVRAGIADERREPNTIADSRDAMRNPRARVFVLFLDVPHVTIHGSWNMREPLVRLIDRILAPDDLVGIMIPRMAASDIVFARKTEVVAGGLRDRWPWGERFTLAEDQQEFTYKGCYPWPATAEVVAEMVARRRERMTLDSLFELVSWLRTEREERKAILTVSEGWGLFQRNHDLTRPRVIDPVTGATEPIPGPEPIGTGPDGRIRIGNVKGSGLASRSDCDRDRQYLSQIDNDRYFKDIIDAANRGNASFYTVDPRGLPVFDSPIGPAPPPPLEVDRQNLTRRVDSLRILADNTDGIAAVNSNDIEKGLRRMSDDLTSYYLLGYYSTNTRLDGRFRSIKVRVKQPGVDVRARRGYKAATEREITEARKAAPSPVPERVSLAQSALSGLARLRPSAVFRARATLMQGDTATVWVAGELSAAAVVASAAEISAGTGDTTATTTAALAAGQRGFVVQLPLKQRLNEPIDVRVRIPQGAGQPPLTDMVRLEMANGLSHPLLFRRGPATGNRLEPAAEPSFTRTERARFDMPLAGGVTLSAGRILDRNGAAIELPVAISEHADAGGQRWAAADVILAALAPGDYIIELTGNVSGAVHQMLTAFRVTR